MSRPCELPGTPEPVRWPLTDQIGTVRELLKLVANVPTVVKYLRYDAFGNVTSDSDASVQYAFAYTGREIEIETGLYFYRARYYDPATGAFLSEDPIGFDAGDPNFYRYVGNNPTNATDPTGLFEASAGNSCRRWGAKVSQVLIVGSPLPIEKRSLNMA